MNRGLELLSIALFALNAGVVGGESPPRLRTRPELRWTSATCAAKSCRSLRVGVP